MCEIIRFHNFYHKRTTKGEKMYKNFLKNIRKKSKAINDMPVRAQEVLDYFQINNLTSGVPVVEILINLGFKIFQSELEPAGLSAYIAVDPKFESVYGSNKITCVHINDSVGHKKFALAHELGHYLFDFNESENLYYYNTYFPEKDTEEQEPNEKRANKFAANLLMPQDAFLNKYEEYKKLESKVDIVTALCRYFVVSPTAVIKRFDELGINNLQA